MFAFLATRDTETSTELPTALAQLARDHELRDTEMHQLARGDFRLAFFDTASELETFEDDRFVILLIGTLLNRTYVEEFVGQRTGCDAELVLRAYRQHPNLLSNIDGHFACIIYDSEDGQIAMVGDRFHRYTIVYTDQFPMYISSRSYLLDAMLNRRTIDMGALSQAVHFRWLMGERKLLKGVKQVLPGSVTYVDARKTTKVDSYFKPSFDREKNSDIHSWVREVDTALDACLSGIAKHHPVIGIPLSGGVDSSLLLAKAKEHFHECVAVTARFTEGENPELENARAVAKQLGVRHIVATIDDDYIREFFPKLVRIQEQPPRNFSDIALARSLQALKGEVDAFIYGEAADTLFGLDAVHRIVATGRWTRPFDRLPASLRRLAARNIPDRGYSLRRLKWALEHGTDALVHAMEKIPYVTPPWQLYSCSRLPAPDSALVEYLAHGRLPLGDRASIQLLSTGVMNHIENTGRLASNFGLTMYVPFVLNDVRSVAVRIPFELQQSKGAYKLILRELACRYFDRNYIYSEKFGFPTPTRHWLKGPLNDRVQRAVTGCGQGKKYYCSRTLSSLSLDKDFEHFWFAICLDELIEQLEFLSADLRVAA
jgi:asparagine synthase (glutamine-hydrolysing)